jgi:hypothetical protein
MENSNKDLPAFPTEIEYDEKSGTSTISHGLTKREYFAACAMQATDLEAYANNYGNKWAYEVAKDSIAMADELLKQLNQ